MPVLDVVKDPQALTVTITSQFSAPRDRVWQIWSDPRQLERWWGPPTWPATFKTHDLRTGGSAGYFMTGPDGDTAHGWWRVLTVDEPTSLEVEDGFADQQGVPDPGMPVTRMVVTLSTVDSGTLMTMVSTFPSLEALEQMVAMGMIEGVTLAMGQIDGLLTVSV